MSDTHNAEENFRCHKFKSMRESDWREAHAHGHIVEEDFPGVQPPTYVLVQLRCLTCEAKLVMTHHREANS